MNKADNKYSIDIYNLASGKHEFELSLGKELIEMFGAELSDKLEAKAKISVKKSETTIEVQLFITGIIELICDRSLDSFDYLLSIEEIIFYKYGESYQELDDNLIVITHNQLSLDFSQHLYDFIMLSLPSKRIHPDLRDEEGESEEDEETEVDLFFSTEEESDNEEGSNNEGNIDPRWAKLKNLNNDNK